MKSTNRFYWDYNATSPLSDSVLNWIRSEDVPFGNPSSIHSPGIKSKQHLLETSDFLLEFFGLVKSHEVFFTSGASESINTLFRSAYEEDKNLTFHVFLSDHSTSFELGNYFKDQQANVIFHKPLANGDFPLDSVAKEIKAEGKHFLNFTWVNSESGVIWPLALIGQLKKINPDLYIHVDGVQGPGKLSEYKLLNPEADAYTFSGHKFGALKGVGFTFLKNKTSFNPFVLGGGQQRGRRSGTENVMGAYSLKLALEELESKADLQKVGECRLNFEKKLQELFPGKLTVVGENSSARNLATSLLLIEGISLTVFLTALDMAGIYVSSGSACSSGSLKPSRVLLSMGYSEKEAATAVRFSFGPYLDQVQIDQGLAVLTPILERFLKK